MEQRRVEESVANYEEIRRDWMLGEQPQPHLQAQQVLPLWQK
jgi:hypothetical protein